MSRSKTNGNGHELMPHDTEAELVVVGNLLSEPSAIAEAQRFIDAGDFYSLEHATVYKGIRRIVASMEGTRVHQSDVMPVVPEEIAKAAVEAFRKDLRGMLTCARQIRQQADARRAMDAAGRMIEAAKTGGDWRAELDRVQRACAPPPWSEAQNTIEVLPMGDITEGKIDWLWDQRIVRGGLNILGGRGGQAKSVFTCDVAARVSTGKGFPLIEGIDDASVPCSVGNTAFVNFESDAGREIKPRLRVAGADMSRIVLVKGHIPREDGSTDMIDLTRDVPMIEKAMDDRFPGEGLALMVIDPIIEFLPGVKTIDTGEVRKALHPLMEFAQRRQVAVIMIVHDNKGAHSNAQDKAGGSGAFVHACRAGWRLDPDPNTPPESGNRKLMTVVKPNLMRRQFGMSFEVKSSEEDREQPVLHWDAKPFWKTADQVLQDQQHVKKNNSKTDEAAEFCETELRNRGPMRSKDLLELLFESKGVKEGTAKRALHDIGAVNQKFGKVWWWRLKDQEWPADTAPLLNQSEGGDA